MTAPLVVLHVCTGNICRSPMAELLMRAELDAAYGAAAAGVELDGAGTYSGHAGDPIHPPAGSALRALGLDSGGFRAQALTRAAIERADLVLCAAAEHVHRVTALVPAAAARTFTILDLAELAGRCAGDLPPTEDPVQRLMALRRLAAAEGLAGRRDVEDPYGRPPDVYSETARQLQGAVRAVVGAPTRVDGAPRAGDRSGTS